MLEAQIVIVVLLLSHFLFWTNLILEMWSIWVTTVCGILLRANNIVDEINILAGISKLFITLFCTCIWNHIVNCSFCAAGFESSFWSTCLFLIEF